jgi:hypothetical protein
MARDRRALSRGLLAAALAVMAAPGVQHRVFRCMSETPDESDQHSLGSSRRVEITVTP